MIERAQLLWRLALAEFIGTFALCVVGVGTVCTNAWTGGSPGLLGIALAHGGILAVMISSLGHISGGHFNPAVTLAAFVANRLSKERALVYFVAQLTGAVAGSWLIGYIVPFEVWRPIHLGTPGLADGLDVMGGLLLECVLTFFLVFTVFATALDERGPWKAIAGFGIGGALAVGILIAGPLTGAALNPARAFGPALVSSTWTHQLVYWSGPLLGGVIAGACYSTFFLGKRKS